MTTSHPDQVLATLGLKGRAVGGRQVQHGARDFIADATAGFVWSIEQVATSGALSYRDVIRVGDKALVSVTYGHPGRQITRPVSIRDALRLYGAHLVTDVAALDAGVYAFGYALGTGFSLAVMDRRGAASALLRADLFNALLPNHRTNEGRRARASAAIIEFESSAGRVSSQTIAAGAVAAYLDHPEDTGTTTRAWWITECGTEVAGSPQPDRAHPLGRLARTRSVAATALTNDVYIRSKPTLAGAARRHFDPLDTRLRPRHARRSAIQWHDPAGETASALADGEITLSAITGVVTPWSADVRTAFGAQLDLLLEAGLTNRQALILLNATVARFPYEEIARAFGCSVGTVKATVNRAKSLARGKLGRD